jgi:uncharacterized membrane protein
MNKKIKEASDLTNKLISDAVKNIQSNNDDYIIDYFTKLISSVKAKLEVTQFKDSKNSLKAEISIRPRFMSVLDSAIIFARRIIYLNLILKQNTAWRLP